MKKKVFIYVDGILKKKFFCWFVDITSNMIKFFDVEGKSKHIDLVYFGQLTVIPGINDCLVNVDVPDRLVEILITW